MSLTVIIDKDYKMQVVDNEKVDPTDFVDCGTRLIQVIKEEDIITNPFLRIEDEINHHCEELYKKGRNPDTMLITSPTLTKLCQEFGMDKDKKIKLRHFNGIFGQLNVHEVEMLDGDKRLLICCS
jgi:hypothetical protein